MTVAQATQAGDKIQIKGQSTKEDADYSQIIINTNKAKAQVDAGDEVRHSNQTMISRRHSLTESEVLNMVTDAIMSQMKGGDVADSVASFHLSRSMER